MPSGAKARVHGVYHARGKVRALYGRVGFVVVVEVAERCTSIRTSCTDDTAVDELESEPSWSNKRPRVIHSLLILPVSAG
jgi:hypothetical protein